MHHYAVSKFDAIWWNLCDRKLKMLKLLAESMGLRHDCCRKSFGQRPSRWWSVNLRRKIRKPHSISRPHSDVEMPLRSFKALGNLMEFEGLVSLLAMVLDVIWVIWVIFNLKHITKVLISMRDVRLSLRCVTLAVLHSGAANLQESFDWFSVIFSFSATVTGFTLR